MVNESISAKCGSAEGTTKITIITMITTATCNSNNKNKNDNNNITRTTTTVIKDNGYRNVPAFIMFRSCLKSQSRLILRAKDKDENEDEDEDEEDEDKVKVEETEGWDSSSSRVYR
ncbi:hypothetical protein HZH66_004184 [Vespula vulgaris]|uniref:Uncharacterized protein n=1 Tax=Vespula vulgaris TaxID=7454 RepID=A0A834KEL4_VESVU|nr:hypothetical protein HZH66_004184 [Vespula vulgaris]